MSDGDRPFRLTLRFSDALVGGAEEIAEQTLDVAAVCQHREGYFICGLHPQDGPMCHDCMRDHLRGHRPHEDATCSACGRLAETKRGAVAAGEFAVLTFTCSGCSEA